jgi:hypothetical protein
LLKQICDLFRVAAVRTHRLNDLAAQWPESGHEAYREACAGLVSKGLITRSPDEQFFSITPAGIKAML